MRNTSNNEHQKYSLTNRNISEISEKTSNIKRHRSVLEEKELKKEKKGFFSRIKNIFGSVEKKKPDSEISYNLRESPFKDQIIKKSGQNLLNANKNEFIPRENPYIKKEQRFSSMNIEPNDYCIDQIKKKINPSSDKKKEKEDLLEKIKEPNSIRINNISKETEEIKKNEKPEKKEEPKKMGFNGWGKLTKKGLKEELNK